MRLLLLCILASVGGLTSCVYYGDIHGNSHPLDTSSLSTTHVYKPSPKLAQAVNWWEKFHDDQLNQLINTALNDAPTMQIAEARVSEAQHLALEASSSLWPSVDFSGSVERERFSEFGLVPPPFNGRTYNIGTLGLNFNYEFDFWGKNRQLLMAKLNEKYAQEAELAEARLVISAAVTNTYFELRGYSAQVKIANANWRANQKLLAIASNRSLHGIESDIPVKTIQANIQTANQALEQYQQAAMLARHQLAVLLGDNPFTTDIETRPFAFHYYHVTLPSSLPASLLANRPDIAAAKLRAEAAANQINVAKAGFFPDINLTALFSYQSAGLGHLFNVQSQNNGIGAAIDLPIFDAGARRANLGVKYDEYDLAVNTYNQTILTALREVADQQTSLQTVGSQLAAENIATRATEHHYKLIHSRYNHGIADYADLLQSKQLLMQHQLAQLEWQTRYLQTVVGMMKALGGNV